MLMQSVNAAFRCAGFGTLLLVSSCTPANEDSAHLDCSGLSKTFFQKPASVRMNEFGTLDVERQYAVFICGNQFMEPPTIELAGPFAKEGQAVVGFLKAKLAAARGDLTIRDILLVFEEMSKLKTYDVAADSDLMKVIELAVGKVK